MTNEEKEFLDYLDTPFKNYDLFNVDVDLEEVTLAHSHYVDTRDNKKYSVSNAGFELLDGGDYMCWLSDSESSLKVIRTLEEIDLFFKKA